MHDIWPEFVQPRPQDPPIAQDAWVLPPVLLNPDSQPSALEFDVLHRSLSPALVLRTWPHAHERTVIAGSVVGQVPRSPSDTVHYLVGVGQVGDSRPPP